MKHIMVDIETLGLGADAVVTEIGACVFDETGAKTSRIKDSVEEIITFHEYINPVAQIKFGRSVDADTLHFRAEKTPNLLTNSFLIPPEWKEDSAVELVQHSLGLFLAWVLEMAEEDDFLIWCNGTDFDAAILKHLFKTFSVLEPWGYNQFRDLRTLRTAADMLGIEVEKRKNDHNALNDALNQATEAAEIMAEINDIAGNRWRE